MSPSRLPSPALPAVIPDDAGGLGGQPRGLTTLFFTEMWERFSYYGMRALLVLFMVAPAAQGGLGFDTVKAATIYGNYTMGVYLLTILGGWIADRFTGARRAVLIGGIIIAAGHFSMAFGSLPAFYAGLGCIALGTGLLKPNVSTMVGGLYAAQDLRRDAGFSIFYMGINLGAFIAPLLTGFLAQSETFRHALAGWGLNPLRSWHWGFAAAGVGMTLGLIQYVWQGDLLGEVGKKPARRSAAASAETDAPLTTVEWKRLAAIVILCLFVIIFWGIFEQAGSTLNLFADRLTRTEFFGWKFPSSWFQSVQPLLVIIMAPTFAWIWLALGARQPSIPVKFTLGLFFLALSFALLIPAAHLAGAGRVGPFWLVGVYFLQTVGEMCLSPVGLSTVTKLSPPKLVGLMMGAWFVAAGLGNKLAGFLASFFTASDTARLAELFTRQTLGVLAATALLAALIPFLKRLIGGIK